MKGVRLALRLSRGAGRHERVRSLVMIVGVALATLGLAVGVTLPRVTAQQQEVRDARPPSLLRMSLLTGIPVSRCRNYRSTARPGRVSW